MAGSKSSIPGAGKNTTNLIWAERVVTSRFFDEGFVFLHTFDKRLARFRIGMQSNRANIVKRFADFALDVMP